MTKFKITRDVEMRKFFEQPPESASSPLPCSAGVMKNTLNPNIIFIVTRALEANLDDRYN
jgi:hypothetical protein